MMILVFIEHKDGALNKVSLEAVTAAQTLGKELNLKVAAVIPAANADELSTQIAGYELEKVIVAKSDKLSLYTPDGYTDAFAEIAKANDAQFIIAAHTYQVRDFFPKLAARFGKEMVGDCIRHTVENNAIKLTRRIFLGKLDSDVVIEGDAPFFVTFQAGSFRGDNAAKGNAQIENVDVEIAEPRMKPEPAFQEVKASIDLSKSSIIVAVGRGIKSQENIAMAQQLADILGADLAASRPICDAEWLPLERQIGSSGQTVAPKVYIALGISGAIQHLVGMKNAGTIIAINKDAEAPIFDIADYGIVGDMFEAVPVLVEE
ncbi:MAG: electron transfer flavoprotein subunit alpha/FixB family protein, partial [Pyrinomonadaceae bacterium]|nr:electron transfer flavoprotein subunit alpha/FixB family protein [Pyrinomonadaceae bacterium]